jgi:hypothetical protein
MKQWEKEHGPEYDIPSLIGHLVEKKVLQDISWHNDSAPSFAILAPNNEEYGIRLWVDHPIKSMRETENERFAVQLGQLGSESDEEISTDDLETALTKIFDFARAKRFEDAEIRKQRWWDDTAEGFELAHEFLVDLRKSPHS